MNYMYHIFHIKYIFNKFINILITFNVKRNAQTIRENDEHCPIIYTRKK